MVTSLDECGIDEKLTFGQFSPDTFRNEVMALFPALLCLSFFPCKSFLSVLGNSFLLSNGDSRTPADDCQYTT
jgi:hypothetical protein